MKFPITIISLFFLFGCASKNEFRYDPHLTQEQVRYLQTKTFDMKDAKPLMKAIVAVLQDEGFIVKNTNLDLAVITAEKNIDIENKWKSFFSSMLSGARATWNKHAVLEASANLMEHGQFQKLRVNFSVKVFDNFGRVVKIHPITDKEQYNQFFNKVCAVLYLPEN